MSEVELISLAYNYLINLGYDIDMFKDYLINSENEVVFKYVYHNKPESNKEKYLIGVSGIKVYIDEEQVNILEITSDFSYDNINDFYNLDNSKLDEKLTKTNISFNHIKNNVIKSFNKEISYIYNGKTINKVNNMYSDIINVSEDYKLVDGYPIDYNKKLIKE